MPPIVIVDTSVLLNVLDVPGFNQDRDAVLDEFGELVDDGANLLLPMGAIFETGNHIADVRDGRQRRNRAEAFRDRVSEALAGLAPWTLPPLPDTGQLTEWLKRYLYIRSMESDCGNPKALNGMSGSGVWEIPLSSQLSAQTVEIGTPILRGVSFRQEIQGNGGNLAFYAHELETIADDIAARLDEGQ